MTSLTACSQSIDAANDDEPPTHAVPFVAEESCLMVWDKINGDKWGNSHGSQGSWKNVLIHRLQAVLRKMNDGRTSEKTAVPNPLRSKACSIREQPLSETVRRDGPFCITWNTWHC